MFVFPLGDVFELFSCLLVRRRAYPSTALFISIRLPQKKLSGNKHSSLICCKVSDEETRHLGEAAEGPEQLKKRSIFKLFMVAISSIL